MSEAATPDVPVTEQAPSISAAAHAYQLAMNQQSTTPTSTASPAAQVQAQDMARDVVMSDGTPDRPAVCIFGLHPS
jgi:COMPASS component SDC1